MERQSAAFDRLAFGAQAAFLATLWLSLGQWLPQLEPLHVPLALSAVALAGLVARRATTGRPLWLGARGAALVAFLALCALSVTWSLAPELSRAAALEVGKLVLLYVVIVNVVTTPRRLGFALALMAAAAVVPALGTLSNWRDGTLLVDGFRARWLGVLADPNHDAMALVAVVPLALTFALRTVGVRRVLWLAAAAACVGAVVTTHSRGGALGLALAVLVWALLYRSKAQAVALALAGLAAVAAFAPTSFWARNETIGDYAEDASAMGRVHAWQVAGAILRDRPLTGTGAGAFLEAWPVYAPLGTGHTRYVAHNVILEVAAEEGLPAVLLFSFFVAACARGAWRARRDPEVGPLASAVFASLAGYVLCDLMSGYSLSWYLYVLCGLGAAAERARAAVPREAPELVPLAA